MGFVGGKRIRVHHSSRKESLDLVFQEDIQRKTFFVFVTRETAKQIMLLGEDLLMKPFLKTSKWQFHEEGRTVEVEVVPNRRGNSLVIKTITSDDRQWRRRVFIPEGRYGEGWLSFSRQIRESLRHPATPTVSSPHHHPILLPPPTFRTSRSSPPTRSLPISSAQGIPSWPRVNVSAQTSSRFGTWEFMVVCSVNLASVDWQMVGLRLAKAFNVNGDFDLFPFSSNQAIIIATSAEEQDLLCSGNSNFTAGEGINLAPWRPGVNTISLPHLTTDGWIGIAGLPFHLWHSDLFTTIANHLGGLLAISDNTRFFNDLSLARIQVAGHVDSLPHIMEIEEGDETFRVELRPIRAPEQTTTGTVRISVPVSTPEKATPVQSSATRMEIQQADLSLKDSAPVHQPIQSFSLFDTSIHGEGSDLNLEGGNQFKFPKEVRQGLCAYPTFKRPSTLKRHMHPRKTGIWLQRDKLDGIPSFEGENSESTHGTEFCVSNHQEVADSNATSSPQSLNNSEGPTQENNSLRSPCRTVTRAVSDDMHVPTPPFVQENINGSSPTVEQVADFIKFYGIDTTGQNMKLLENVMNRGLTGLKSF